MLTYFSIATSTATIVETFNYVVDTWSNNQFVQLFLIIMGIMFALMVFALLQRYVFDK